MKILLVIKNKMMEYLGVMYLAAVAKQAGHEARIVALDDALSYAGKWRPDMAGYSVMTGDENRFSTLNNQIKKTCPDTIRVFGGPHSTFFPEDFKGEKIVKGEAEQWMADALSFKADYSDINSIPWPDRTGFPGMKVRDFIASRGCPAACLTGNTIIHTIEGDVPIKELVGRNVKVLSRNPVTQEPLYVEARHIRKTREMAEIVRVHFDDGSHIDCTPDHKFMVFSYKNQFNPIAEEREVEAQNLRPKQQVRAFNITVSKEGRKTISTTRDIRCQHTILVMSSVLNRQLLPDERVHHKDRSPGNDMPNNLVLTTKSRHVPDWHPEVSERMKKNNPVNNIAREILSARAKRCFGGRKQSLEERLKRRERQLGEKNSNYKPWVKHQVKPSRIKEAEVNHKILYVEPLSSREDVYCMEVPDIHWFYANKVLVHNCHYCFNDRWNKMFPHLAKVRVRSVEDVIAEVKAVRPEYVYFQDSCFALSPKWLEAFSEQYRNEVNLPFQCHMRPNQINRERAKLLSNCHCVSIRIALETASSRLRALMNRGKMDQGEVRRAIQILKKNKIQIMVQQIIGLPDGDIEDDMETLAFNIICKPTYSWVSIYQPYPGTVMGERCKAEGWYSGDFSEIGDSFFDKSVLNFSDEYKEQLVCLQRIFSLCVETGYMPEIHELTIDQLPGIIHRAMRKLGDDRLYLGVL